MRSGRVSWFLQADVRSLKKKMAKTRRGKRILPSPQYPDRLWGTPSLVFNGYVGARHLGIKLLTSEAGSLTPCNVEVTNAWMCWVISRSCQYLNHLHTHMVRWLMNGKFDKLRKETAVAYSRYHSGICLEGLGKTKKYLWKDSRYSGQDSNLEPPEYKSGLLYIVVS
jgi:hypothetical protein